MQSGVQRGRSASRRILRSAEECSDFRQRENGHLPKRRKSSRDGVRESSALTGQETASAVPCSAISIRSHCRPNSDTGVCEERRVGNSDALSTPVITLLLLALPARPRRGFCYRPSFYGLTPA
jgi:hypothetical protein